MRRSPLPALLLLVLLSAAMGCGQPPAPVSLWGGFDYSWERISHRVSFFESGLGEPSPDGSFTMDLGMIGGPWSLGTALPESVNYRAPWWWIQSDSLQAHYAQLTLSIGPSGLAREDVVIDMQAVGLDSKSVVTVALAGLRWDMDVPQVKEFPSNYDAAEGWTPQVLGAGIDDVAVSDGMLTFSVWLEFLPGPLDRQDMNEAMPFLTIGGSLSYVVLAADGALTEAEVQASAWYLIDPPNSDIPAIEAEQRTVVIDGQDGLPIGVPVIRSFRFVLNREIDGGGRYLRSLSSAVESFEYSAASGQATVVMDAYCSHSSVLEEGDLQVEYSADIGLLQLADGEASVLSGARSGAAAVGPFTEYVVP